MARVKNRLTDPCDLISLVLMVCGWLNNTKATTPFGGEARLCGRLS